jgi:diacylglycerol kinase
MNLLHCIFVAMNRFLKSLSYAIQGISHLLLFERNTTIQSAIALVVIGLGFWLKISGNEWIALLFGIGLVLAAEAFNTAMEHLCNLVEPNPNPKIKIIKDLSAGAVLLISIAVSIIGIIIFLPKILTVLYH